MDETPTTLLEAVNVVLENDSEQRVAQLEEGGFAPAANAEAIIHEVSREVQTKPCSYNRDIDYQVSPNLSDEIDIPTNAMNIETGRSSLPATYVERAGKVYDLDNNTFVFSGPIYLNITRMLAFDELPEHARRYIAVLAARVYQKRYTGSEESHGFSYEDEVKARANYRRLENRILRRSSLQKQGRDHAFYRRTP